MNHEWLGMVGTGLVILAYLPQVSHLIKEKCSAGLSVGAYLVWTLAAVLLLVYAIGKSDLVFIALQAYQVVATLLIFYYGKKYKGHFCELHGGEME